MGKPKMPRGPKKHLKRLAAPSAWMLDKLGGKYAPHPSAGPHKLRECLPLCIFIRNRLKYALSGREVSLIVKQRLVKVDTKGRFAIHRISAEEAEYKLCKVKKVQLGDRGIPYIVTHDGRTIRYPDPAIKVNDSVKLDLNENKIVDFLKFEVGQTVMATGGRNMGRAGTIVHRGRHPGGFDMIKIRDPLDREFSTRITNVFIIGTGGKPWVSLPKGKGVKLSIAEERDQRRRQKEKAA